MLFNSYAFLLIFLPLTLLALWIARKGGLRPAVLVVAVASLVFYAQWDIRFLPVLLGSVFLTMLLVRACLRPKI